MVPHAHGLERERQRRQTASAAGYGSNDIWLIDLTDPAAPVNITGDSGDDQRHASWSPDDAQMVFRQIGPGPRKGIFVMNSDGTDRVKISKLGSWPIWE